MLSFEGIVTTLLYEEMRRAGSDNAMQEALYVRGRNSEQSKSRFGGKNKLRG